MSPDAAGLDPRLAHHRWGQLTRARTFPTTSAAAAIAASLDVAPDGCGLDLGLWAWRDGGPCAAERVGSNGARGIPAANFAGWLGLIGTLALAYLALDRRALAAGRAESTMLAGLLIRAPRR